MSVAISPPSETCMAVDDASSVISVSDTDTEEATTGPALADTGPVVDTGPALAGRDTTNKRHQHHTLS